MGHWFEILALLTLALLVFGPKRMIEMGSSLGKAFRELRDAAKEMDWSGLTGSSETPSTPSPPSQPRYTTPYAEPASTPPTPPVAAPPPPPESQIVEGSLVVDDDTKSPTEHPTEHPKGNAPERQAAAPGEEQSPQQAPPPDPS
jgi:sec-independent protein translocase protein TatA